MRLSVFRDREGPVVDPSDPRLISGTPEQMRHAMRELQRHQVNAAIVRMKTEIPRAELDFEALGGRVIEHLPTGDFFGVFGGDPAYVGDDVRFYFVNRTGDPIMLQTASPPSRADLEKRQAAKAKRHADREAEMRERRAQIRAAAR